METIQTQNNNTKLTPDNTSIKFLTGVGIVALLIVAVWLGVQAVRFGADITSGLAGARSFFNFNNDIVVTATPNKIVTEGIFTLSWEDELEEDGIYTVRYECTGGVHLTSPISENTGNVVFCDTPLSVDEDATSLELSVVSVNESPTDILVYVEFTPEGDDEIDRTGEVAITVVSDESQIAGTATTTDEDDNTDGDEETPVTPITTPGPVTTITTTVAPVNDPNGTPDLVIRILETGIVTRSGDFTAITGEVDPDENVAIRFEVENIGTKETGEWRFESKLPTEPKQTYRSPRQESLLPGTRVDYILGFEDAEDDEDTITIRIDIDSDDKVDESNEANNDDSVTIDIKQ